MILKFKILFYYRYIFLNNANVNFIYITRYLHFDKVQKCIHFFISKTLSLEENNL